MSRVLFIGEQRQGVPAGGSDRLAMALSALAPVSLLLHGPGCRQASQPACRWPGVDEVLVEATEPELPHNAESLAPWLQALIQQGHYSHIAMPAGPQGRDVLPRLAALMDRPMISETIAMLDAATFQRPVAAGRGVATVRATATPVLLTLRASAFPMVTGSASQPVRVISLTSPARRHGSQHLAFLPSPGGRPELATARVVVAGGQGVGNPADFQLVQQLADRLNGAVGASRSAVDAGFAPNDWQIGQTGKVIAPQLYIAVGISGAIQHLAGIQGAGTIMAINTDPHAPIFAISDYGLVADLRQALPLLLQLLAAK